MFRISSLIRSGAPLALSAGRRLKAAVLPCVVAFGIPAMVAWAAHGHAAAPGLTGADRPDDVVQARQLLMDGVESELMIIDLAISGRRHELSDLQSRAYLISSLLTVLPHLFPPETRPDSAGGAASSTNALPTIWEDFEGFYAAAQAAASVAFDASQAKDMGQLTTLAKTLHDACDSCHASHMQVYEPPQT